MIEWYKILIILGILLVGLITFTSIVVSFLREGAVTTELPLLRRLNKK